MSARVVAGILCQDHPGQNTNNLKLDDIMPSTIPKDVVKETTSVSIKLKAPEYDVIPEVALQMFQDNAL